jgi:hypothetical protein
MSEQRHRNAETRASLGLTKVEDQREIIIFGSKEIKRVKNYLQVLA